jgi:pimeloyl-ACP methyl ester carboxylesterase
MWEPQLALAQEGWRVIAPHARGADGAPSDPPASSIDDYAADLVDLLDALHVEEVVACGLSMGGYVAFALLRLAPGYVRGLVLADTRAQADSPEGVADRQRMLRLLAEKGAAAIVDEMVPKLLGETTRRTQPAVERTVRSLALANPEESIAGSLRALMSRPDSTALLSSIRVPTLIVVGEEDRLTPPPLAEAMQRGIAGSELVTIPSAGHLANLEQPTAFNDALARFLHHRV